MSRTPRLATTKSLGRVPAAASILPISATSRTPPYITSPDCRPKDHLQHFNTSQASITQPPPAPPPKDFDRKEFLKATSSISRTKPRVTAMPSATTATVESHSRNASIASNSHVKSAFHVVPQSSLAPTTRHDYGTSNNLETRRAMRTHGLLPPNVESFEKQVQRCLAILESRPTPIEKYQYLSVLRNTDVHLFYRLLAENVKELTPLIYTPTVGEACQRWSELYTHPEGMYLSFEDRGRLHEVVKNWPHEVDITVVTDGSRILGLGDLGVNGMGIPVGKLSLYTACAGIHPLRTLPLCLDLGTSNEAFRNDPLYLGSRRDKVTAEEEKEFLDEMMEALTARWPNIIIQYEDFKNPFPSLERYQHTYTMFNDDIQGTGAVILGGFINAVKQSGVAPADQRAVFLGAGSAGVGVAKQLTEFFMKEGLTEDEARKRFWLVDSQGLVTLDRPSRLAEHKVYFARDDNEGQQYKTLEEIVEYVKPTMLIGLSTIGGAFTPQILTRMAELNERPVIFPLSNPSSKSECTFEEAIQYTNGRCLFASGSPFPNLNHNGTDLVPGQGNNMYVFPGIGLAAILCKAEHITQSMIYASGEALASSLTPTEVSDLWLYPDLRRIREVSVVVARGVIRAAQEAGVDREVSLRSMSDAEIDAYIRARMYDPYVSAHNKLPTVTPSVANTAAATIAPLATQATATATMQQSRPRKITGTFSRPGTSDSNRPSLIAV